MTPALGTAHGQEKRVTFFGETTTAERFGESLAWIDDRDGDGVDDLLVGAPGTSRVRLLSGADFALQLEIVGAPTTDFGARLALIADLDGDGRDDLAIGAPAADEGRGWIELRSSATGAPLGEVIAFPHGVAFGACFTVVGDVDNDGTSELAVALQLDIDSRTNEPLPPSLALFSTRDGSLLAAVERRPSTTRNVTDLIAIGDRDHDGVPELAVLGLDAPDDPTRGPGEPVHGATIVHGRDLSFRANWPTRDDRGRLVLPSSIARAGDCDGDGIGDLIVCRRGFVSHTWSWPFDSELWVVSGADGKALRHWHERERYFGGGLAEAGDVDGDGTADIAVARHWFDINRGLEVQMQVVVLSVRTGAVLRQIDGDRQHIGGFDRSPSYGIALAGGRDLDEDGAIDLVIGDAGSSATSTDGAVLAWDASDDVTLAQRLAVDTQFGLYGGIAWCDDVDHDGIDDFAVGEVDWGSAGSVALRSGRDGSLLHRMTRSPLDDRFGVSIARLPDLDGDGVGDLAIGGRGVVEIRSASTGALLLTLTEELDDEPVTALACGAIEGGPIELLAGQSAAGDRRFVPGRALLFDLASGALLHRFDGFQNHEGYGFSVAWLGDVSGDGVSDWAIGAPYADGFYDRAGRVHVVNGALRKVLRQWFGTGTAAALGVALAAVGDVDGDGFGEFLLCEPNAGGDSAGSVRMIAGKSWRELLRIEGDPYDRLGGSVAVVEDANGDGVPELAATIDPSAKSRVRVFSLATGARLATIGPGRDKFGWPLAATTEASVGRTGSGRPEVAIVDSNDRRPGFRHPVGRIEWWSLPPLFLELNPTTVATGEQVIGHVRGAPAGSFAGIYLEAIDGVPFEQFLDFGFCDATGTFRDWSVVPPGMSGLCWSLRGYANGFDGSLVESSAEELLFE